MAKLSKMQVSPLNDNHVLRVTYTIYFKWFLLIISLLFLLPPPISHASENGRIIRSLQSETEPAGKLYLQFNTPKDNTLDGVASTFKESDYFYKIVKELNKAFILQTNIHIIFGENEGPVYYPGTKTIDMSYDFILYLSGLYLNEYPKATRDDMISFAEESTTFFLYHEFAHALIDIYKMPIVSNEETAADNLAVIIALEYTDNGYNIAMNTADLFNMLDKTNEKYDDDDLWDEHTLDSQRFYNILCLTYGKYPEKVTSELKETNNKILLKFIQQKGDYCIEYYALQYKSWMELLDIHFAPEQ